MMRSIHRTFVAAVILACGVHAQAASRLEKGEELLFFPDYAWLSPDETHWTAMVHGWDYRTEPDPKRRERLARSVGRSFGLTADQMKAPDFAHRARWFYAPSGPPRTLRLNVAGRPVALKRTLTSGHIHAQVVIPRKPGEVLGDTPLRLRIELEDSGGNPVVLPVRRLAPEGLVIVTDIDDSIKVTGVGQRKELLANTLVNPYQAVEGMPLLYQGWAASNSATVFFYLSAAPWQLYPELAEFFKKAGFPRGIFRLQHFRRQGQSFGSLWRDSAKFKTPILEELFARFPKRTFTLVGDSGEKDPEIFGQLARRHPKQIDQVYIRELGNSPEARYQKAFAGIDPVQWHVFRSVHDLGL